MSQKEHTTVFREILPGDWWYFAAALTAEIDRDHYLGVDIRHYDTPSPKGMTINIYYGPVRVPSIPKVTVIFQASEGATVIEGSAQADDTYWPAKLEHLKAIAQYADMARRSAEPSYDAILERFYRIKSHGGRITLRQLAKDEGVPYSTLTKRKMEYDKEGKWGSGKVRKTTS